MKLVEVILGTRPEAIKLAPVVLSLRRRPGLRCRVTVTAQHRELLDDVLTHFEIEPDADLDLMRPDQTPASFVARALGALGRRFADRPADLVLVQGDTSTAFCAALAAFYQRLPVGHVEAGLRSGRRDRPWPEEMNRRLTARLAHLHFAPTPGARENLLGEGIAEETVFVTGNPVIDALEWTRARLGRTPSPPLPFLDAAGGERRVVLVTCHRREHLPVATGQVFAAIARLVQRHPEVSFVCPVHPNPEVRRVLDETLRGGRIPSNLHLLDPLPYPRFVDLLLRSTLVLTDSGGVQEEAPGLGKPVLVLRETTERPEAVAAGNARLVGTDPDVICEATSRLLEDPAAYGDMARARYPFGDGHAAERIVDLLAEHLEAPGSARPSRQAASPA